MWVLRNYLLGFCCVGIFLRQAFAEDPKISLEKAPSALQTEASSPSPKGDVAEGTTPTEANAKVEVKEASEKDRIYIKLGDPGVRKVSVAVDKTVGGNSVSKDFYTTMGNDLDFTDFFELLPEDHLPLTGAGISPNTFDLDEYKKTGSEFVLKSQIFGSAKKWEAEVHLYEVRRHIQLLAKRYPLVGSSDEPGRELAHAAANDILQVLTGEAGVFRTRIIMTCGKRVKELYLMDFDGKNSKPLTKDKNLALSSSWSPDGKKIVFTSYKPAYRGGPMNPNLYMYDFVTGARKVLSAAIGLNSGGAFHPKENKLVYTFSEKGRGKPEIYVLDLSNNTRRALTDTQFFSVEPHYSPDGTHLAYSSSKTGRPHIWVSNADGTNAKRLTFAGVYNSSPHWSPKGDQIVFTGQENYKNNFNIFLIDPNGSNLHRLTESASDSNENPSFSPDGRFLTYSVTSGEHTRVYTMTVKGSKSRPVSPEGMNCNQPSWSPRL